MKIKAVDHFMIGDRVSLAENSMYEYGVVEGFDGTKSPNNPRMVIFWRTKFGGIILQSVLPWYPDELDIINDDGEIVVPKLNRETRVV